MTTKAVGTGTYLVIQGAAAISALGADWRDIETMRECGYAHRVFPERLLEYRAGKCADAAQRYTAYRLVKREVRDYAYGGRAELQVEGVLEYPWIGVRPGCYMCSMPGREDMSVEVLAGEGDFDGQLLFKWFPATMPGRLMHEMPKLALLRRLSP